MFGDTHPQHCPWCGEWGRFIFKRAHYECQRCNKPVADCCDGERSHNSNVTELGMDRK